MKSRFAATGLGSEDKYRLAGVLPGDAVAVGVTGVPDSIRREFAQCAFHDTTQKVLFPAAVAITGTVTGLMTAMLMMAGSGAWVAPVIVLANILNETVGHGIAQTKFSALNACNVKLSDYCNALLEEGYEQACRNMVKQADERLMRGEMLKAGELAALLTITPDQPAWSEAGIGLQVTILQARQVVACMRGASVSPLTFEKLHMDPVNPVDREIMLECLMDRQVELAEDDMRLPYISPPSEVAEKNTDSKIRPFQMAQTVLWGTLKGAQSAYFVDPPPPMVLPEKVTIPAPPAVADFASHLLYYELKTGRQLPEFPSLRW